MSYREGEETVIVIVLLLLSSPLRPLIERILAQQKEQFPSLKEQMLKEQLWTNTTLLKKQLWSILFLKETNANYFLPKGTSLTKILFLKGTEI